MRVEATCTVCDSRREHEVVREEPGSDFIWLQCCTCGNRGIWTAASRDLKAVPDEDIDIQREFDESVGADIAGNEGWHITDDSTADWALRRIAWHQQQIERRKQFVQREIERLQAYLQAETERHERSIRFFESHLRAYFEQLRQQGLLGDRKTYRLPHGALQMRAKSPKFERDDKQLLEWARQHGLVRVSEAPDWSTIKERLAVTDSMVVVDRETGEVVPGVIVAEPAGETFSVKVEVS